MSCKTSSTLTELRSKLQCLSSVVSPLYGGQPRFAQDGTFVLVSYTTGKKDLSNSSPSEELLLRGKLYVGIRTYHCKRIKMTKEWV